MENQNIQWENWEEQPQENNDQPQINWGEQPQHKQPQMNWGNQPQQEQPQMNWGNQPQQEQPQMNWGNKIDENFPKEDWNNEPENLSTTEEYTLLESRSKISISPELYKLSTNNHQSLKEISNINLIEFDGDGRHTFKPSPNSELEKVISLIIKIGIEKGLKLDSCFLYKANPKESSLNVFRGKPSFSFVYHLDNNSGDIVLDLSSLAGPAIKSHESKEGTLSLIPGWVPYRIGKNNSSQESFLIVGNFV